MRGITILAAALAGSTARAETGDAWTVGIAPRVALAVPTGGLGPGPEGALEIDFALPVLDRRLLLALDTSYARPSHDGGGSDATHLPGNGDYTYTIQEQELKLGFDGVFRLFSDVSGKRLVPYGGLGVLVHMLRSKETTSLAPGTNTNQDTHAGFELLAGVDYRLGPGFVLGDARFAYSGLGHTLTGDSNAGNVTIGVGYRIVF
jgi:opacity protein-like surface antigen